MAPGRVRAPPLAAARARQRIFSMSNILVINASGQETRVALIEHGIISEYYLERKNEKGIVGNIYKGKVVRVLPGMQAAFVDIGLEKAAFLYVADIVSDPSFPGFSEELDEQAAAVLGDPLDSDDLPEPAEDAPQAGAGAETAVASAQAEGAPGEPPRSEAAEARTASGAGAAPEQAAGGAPAAFAEAVRSTDEGTATGSTGQVTEQASPQATSSPSGAPPEAGDSGQVAPARPEGSEALAGAGQQPEGEGLELRPEDVLAEADREGGGGAADERAAGAARDARSRRRGGSQSKGAPRRGPARPAGRSAS